MIAEKMKPYVKNNSAIRMMFEEGNRLRAIYGPENVFDFSLGNPNVPAPKAVKQAILDILDEEDELVLHGYTNSNAGYEPSIWHFFCSKKSDHDSWCSQRIERSI